MKELTIREHEGINVIDSREVAEMIGKKHAHLMRDIQGYEKVISENPKLDSQNFFIKNTYKVDGNNKTYDCYLLTKQGCEMVANKMTGEKGILFTAEYVEAFNKMEQSIKREQIVNIGELSPELQMFKQIFDTVAKQELEQKQMRKDIEDNRKELQGIREVITISTDNWRDDCNNLIKKIGIKAGGYSSIQDVRVEIYNALDKRMGVKLQTRLENKRDRMRKEGVGKTKIKKVNCLDIIAEDKKLIEGYVAIVKEMAIKFGVDKE